MFMFFFTEMAPWQVTDFPTGLVTLNAFYFIIFTSPHLLSFADIEPSLVTEAPSGSSEDTSVSLTILRQKGNYGKAVIEYQIYGGPNPAARDFESAKGIVCITQIPLRLVTWHAATAACTLPARCLHVPLWVWL